LVTRNRLLREAKFRSRLHPKSKIFSRGPDSHCLGEQCLDGQKQQKNNPGHGRAR
jgi:hypothetical protein